MFFGNENFYWHGLLVCHHFLGSNGGVTQASLGARSKSPIPCLRIACVGRGLNLACAMSPCSMSPYGPCGTCVHVRRSLNLVPCDLQPCATGADLGFLTWVSLNYMHMRILWPCLEVRSFRVRGTNYQILQLILAPCILENRTINSHELIHSLWESTHCERGN
jgi:hypothetical protein